MKRKTILTWALAIGASIPLLMQGESISGGILRAVNATVGSKATESRLTRTDSSAGEERDSRQRVVDRTKSTGAIIEAPAVERKASRLKKAPELHRDVKLIGCSYYNDNNRKHPTGMYTISGDGTMSYFKNTSDLKPQAGAWIIGDTYYYYRGYISAGEFYGEYAAFDMSDWSEVNEVYEAFDGNGYASTVAYNKADGLIYGCFGADKGVNSFEFAKLDPVNHKKTSICPIEYKHDWNAMFFDENNTLYVIDISGYLYTVDLNNGDLTLINHTGYYPHYTGGSAYDPRAKRAYWSICTENEAYLLEINPKTGLATKMFDFPYGDEVVGLCVVQPESAAGTPAMVSDLKADFPNGSLSGNVSFTLPSKDVDGKSLNGNLNYRVLLNGKESASGESVPGANINLSMAAEKDDFYDIEVYASNNVGDNVPEMASIYIGHDAPRHPDNVNISWSDGNYTITWDAPKKAYYDGYVDYSELTYTVTRFPDNKVVATGFTDNKYVDNVPVPDNQVKYSYMVQATYDGRISEPEYSNVSTLGSIVPPYKETFDTEEDLIGWTVLNVNDDGVLEWQWKEREGNGLVYIPCNWQWSMDDWLISPLIKLEGGRSYEISFDLWTGDMDELFEFYMGTEPTVKGMNIELIPQTQIYSATPVPYVLLVTPETTGEYYFGIHGISPAYTYWINFDNFSVSAPLSIDAPGTVSDIQVVPDPAGELFATISFTAPDKNFDGTSALKSLTRIDVTRDGEVIKSFENPAIGAEISFKDVVEKEGGYSYGFTAYNEAGHGQTVNASAYIGINYPGAPENVFGCETDKIGEVKITWNPPTKDANDYPLNPDLITYTVVEITATDYIELATGLKDTSFTFQAVSPDTPQTVKQYGVFSVSPKGEGYGAATGVVIVGAPDKTPYTETFPNGTSQHLFGYKLLSQGQVPWSILKDTSLSITDYNGDHGCVAMNSDKQFNESSMLFTGRIKLNLTNPVLSLYTYNLGDMYVPDNNEIELSVSLDGGNTFDVVDKFVVSQIGAASNSWGKISVNLAKYVGESVIIGINGITRNYGQIYIDNIEITNGLDNDVALTKVEGPKQVKINDSFNVSMMLVNNGKQTAQGVSVVLYRNGQIHSTKENIDLQSGQYLDLVFSDVLTPMDEEVTYQAEAIYSADSDFDNNTSAAITVIPFKNYAPMVDNLKYTADDSGVSLSWNAPEVPTTQTITEDFESYVEWANERIGDWTLYDGDKAEIGSVSSMTLPVNGKQSFWVMDASNVLFSDVYSVFAPHSGDKYLAQMYPIDMYGYPTIPADDWLISPQLSGNAQTISFFARSITTSNPETFEVLYSTTGVKVDDFKKIDMYSEISNLWTEYSIDLPEGAKYFAIRCVTKKGFMFFVDDITYSIKPNYTLKGYNVYHNGKKLTGTPVTETTFRHDSREGGDYGVSAVYSAQESKAAIVSAPASINGVNVNSPVVTVEANEIVVKTEEPVNVAIYSLDGRIIKSGMVENSARFMVEKGVYLVETGNITVKAMVK